METCVDGTQALGARDAAQNAPETGVPSAGLLTAAEPEAGVEASDAAATPKTIAGVLRIGAMPRRFRPMVEEAMARCVTSDPSFVVPGDDPLYAQWCTRWFKDVPADNLVAIARGTAGAQSGKGVPAGIGCHQVLTGTRAELASLDADVRELAAEHGFRAQVDIA